MFISGVQKNCPFVQVNSIFGHIAEFVYHFWKYAGRILWSLMYNKYYIFK